ncbi:MAG: TonB family protein [Cyclobacteriaceae bacterium]
MNASYFIQANLGLIILASIYFLFLNDGKQFIIKRIFLLGGIFASLLLPVISFQFSRILPFSKIIPTALLPELWITSKSTSHSFISASQLYPIAYTVYIAITLLLSARFLIRLFKLMLFLKKSTVYDFGNYTLLENSQGNSFSFFHWIFIGHADLKEIIIEHELEHAKRYHSFDTVILELLGIIFWFNPIVYSLKRILLSIHEFQADDAVIKKYDANQYCSLLARASLQSADFPIANYFNNSLTLKRIAMIKNGKKKLSTWRLVSSLVLLVGLLTFVACQEQTNKVNEISDSNEIFSNVEEVATPTGGMISFYDYVRNNLKYPEQARKLGVEGKVFIEFTVNKDGTISDAIVTKGIGAGCDKEALQVVKESPAWIPAKNEGKIVRQKMVIPIVFKLG